MSDFRTEITRLMCRDEYLHFCVRHNTGIGSFKEETFFDDDPVSFEKEYCGQVAEDVGATLDEVWKIFTSFPTKCEACEADPPNRAVTPAQQVLIEHEMIGQCSDHEGYFYHCGYLGSPGRSDTLKWASEDTGLSEEEIFQAYQAIGEDCEKCRKDKWGD